MAGELGQEQIRCEVCDATGYVTEMTEPDRGPCPQCNGTGTITEKVWVEP